MNKKKIGYKTLRRLLQAPVRLNGKAEPTVQVKIRGTCGLRGSI